MAKKQKEEIKILKIVYFDENTADDYVEMKNGGKCSTEEEKIKEKANETVLKLQQEFGAKFDLWGYLKGVLNQQLDSDFKYNNTKVLKSTISNSILTDFLKIAIEDEKIDRFKKTMVRVEENSFTHIKIFSPYMTMAKDKDLNFDITKIDEALKSGKGYYEMVIDHKTSEGNNEIKILRFNISSFRNNYGLIDLTKMYLTYFAVKVGQCKLSDLNINNEFKIDKEGMVTADQAVFGAENVTSNNLEKCDVFDVILAGVEYD